MTYLVIGYGGIGQALVSQLLEKGCDVTVFSRGPNRQLKKYHAVDMTHVDAVYQAVDALPELPDVVINTVGLLHHDLMRPEKSLGDVQTNYFFESVKHNTLPSLYLTQALSRRMTKQTELKCVCLSARVSSISDDRLGGWYSYRMSKCALNMLVKNISVDWRRDFPRSAIYGYHPGTVDTKMSKPFQANVPPEKLFTAAQAANYCLQFVEHAGVSDSGLLFDWQSTVIPF